MKKMTSDQFDEIVAKQLNVCTDILNNKALEYAGDSDGDNEGDRLHNFRQAAGLQGCSPKKALAGMMAKHTISVYDMCLSDDNHDIALWSEKITDSINYMLLLRALVEEDLVDDYGSDVDVWSEKITDSVKHMSCLRELIDDCITKENDIEKPAHLDIESSVCKAMYILLSNIIIHDLHIIPSTSILHKAKYPRIISLHTENMLAVEKLFDSLPVRISKAGGTKIIDVDYGDWTSNIHKQLSNMQGLYFTDDTYSPLGLRKCLLNLVKFVVRSIYNKPSWHGAQRDLAKKMGISSIPCMHELKSWIDYRENAMQVDVEILADEIASYIYNLEPASQTTSGSYTLSDYIYNIESETDTDQQSATDKLPSIEPASREEVVSFTITSVLDTLFRLYKIDELYIDEYNKKFCVKRTGHENIPEELMSILRVLNFGLYTKSGNSLRITQMFVVSYGSLVDELVDKIKNSCYFSMRGIIHDTIYNMVDKAEKVTDQLRLKDALTDTTWMASIDEIYDSAKRNFKIDTEYTIEV